MRLKLISTLLLGSVATVSLAQEKLDFSNPLQIPVNLSGNFGELRGTHFHAGLDIKTQQRIGLPVYAPADGYVSRIKVSTWGYGKALYIDHPNGQTTVYGHLNEYAGEIADYVRKRHYAEKAFEVEMFFKKNQMPVKKGQLIAYTGNTGGSGGPHLHYEFRDTKTQKIINPLKEGMDKMVTDKIAPSVNSVFVYPISDDAVANTNANPQLLNYTTSADGTLVVPTVKAKGKISFGIDIFDQADYNANKNGVYSLETYVNGKRLFSYRFDTFSFAESGTVNALIDYERYVKTRAKVQKLFVERPYNLSVLSYNETKGIIDVKPGESYTYKIVLCDYHGNERAISIPIEYDATEAKTARENNVKEFKINADKDYYFERGFASINISGATFYHDLAIDISADQEQLVVGEPVTAFRKNMAISFDTSKLTIDNPDKAFIGKIDEKGRRDFYKTTKKDHIYTIYTKSFGTYKIMIDDKAPTIYKPSFTEGQWLSNANEISFLISDDLSGIDTIEGKINDKWILLDYDHKTKKIVHKFSDGIVTSGKNAVEIKVTDRMGNQAVYVSHFFRK
ncbi:M23 family metallopeptidase [Myroides albus]|uniref:Peptidoglycan DD-metalloendopeptidase family protein n=1 Tax=Myroides albus TaxID=2562892 RepID=A0A6I3LNI4_9FLAO|nr:M23 family metallopeptidase [Myroides albus]MTG97742.1 peptidoglycan DD-metalloendopeptidase family protein [Myroides albus]UVD78709.1 M23 family metallopeptidase [Myroides albus]